MAEILEYAHPERRRISRTLTIIANVTLCYPLIYVGLLYGEWFLAWAVLGHAPQPSINDPKSISGSSWMHPIVLIAMMALFPTLVIAIASNAGYLAIRAKLDRAAALRIGLLAVLWGGMFLLLRSDPAQVMNWWLD